MRDIKIRAWNGAIFRYYPIGMTIYRIDRFELSVTTGVSDKNDVDIYEGDICIADGSLGTITFDNGAYAIIGKDGYARLHELISGEIEIEVVGNIYQNPDMIKDSE